jgi:hypothetical protein
MALIKCKECGNEVSKKAKKCPSCGASVGTKQYSLGKLIVLVLFGWFMYSLFSTDQSPTKLNNSGVALSNERENFRRVGYLKDDAKNRIFTVAYKPNTSEQAILTYAESLMHTSGQMMAAYFYREGSIIPADGVTLADSVFKANDVLYDVPGLSKWRYAFMRDFKGSLIFVDCEKNQGHDLCRKK